MIGLKEAMFYEKKNNNRVLCQLCPHNCLISSGRSGICGVKKNDNGVLYSMIYEQASSLSLDPIEKKPLYKFHPRSKILSVGTVGCNFKCPFCQNHSISMAHADKADTIKITSADLVRKAIELIPQGNIGIAYTYNEPTVWYEYIYETAKLAKSKDLVNVLVTNGYINREPLEHIQPFIDAMNIDLKAFNEDFYRKIVKGNLEDVKATIEISAEKCHVEITTLIIPDLNDSIDEMEEMTQWLSSISPDIPLHLSRFFPRYEMTNKPATSIKTLTDLERIARRHLKNVYLGNV